MINENCGCLDNDEKIMLLKCLESNKEKALNDMKNQIHIKDVDKIRDDIKNFEKTIDKVMHIPLCQ